jgi:hypothetical protein
MDTGNNSESKGSGNSHIATDNLISDILRLVQEQAEKLGKGTISAEWAVEYRSLVWKIRELLQSLGPDD